MIATAKEISIVPLSQSTGAKDVQLALEQLAFLQSFFLSIFIAGGTKSPGGLIFSGATNPVTNINLVTTLADLGITIDQVYWRVD